MEEGRLGCDDDVVFSILLWLPVASLLRFKSVCKSWRSLIESPGFIDQHTATHQNSDDVEERLMVFIMDDYSCGYICYLYSGKYFQSLTTISDLKSIGIPRSLCTKPNSFYTNSFYLIASCNGIICLESMMSAKIYLWNPAIKQYKSLPSPSFDRHSKGNLSRFGSSFENGGIHLGFGFDATTRDYKVVVMAVHGGEGVVKSGIEIYSLTTDSWKIIDAVLPVKSVYDNSKSLPSSDQGMYWIGRNDNDVDRSYHFLILWFDFASEMFDTMSLPDIYSCVPKADGDPHLKLFNLKGKITFLKMIQDNCKVWVLQEYGVKESWTNLYSVRLNWAHFFYGISNTGKIIWGKKDYAIFKSSLCWCDPATQEIMVIHCPYKEISKVDLHVLTYKESLVSFTSATDTYEGVDKKTFGESSSEESSSDDDEL